MMKINLIKQKQKIKYLNSSAMMKKIQVEIMRQMRFIKVRKKIRLKMRNQNNTYYNFAETRTGFKNQMKNQITIKHLIQKILFIKIYRVLNLPSKRINKIPLRLIGKATL